MLVSQMVEMDRAARLSNGLGRGSCASKYTATAAAGAVLSALRCARQCALRTTPLR